MKSKNFILLFIFGLFIFLLPGLVEAACGMSCTFVIPGDPQTPQECSWMKGGACACERLGFIGNIVEIDTVFCTNNYKFCCGTECNYNSRKCKCNAFPSGANGESCAAKDGDWSFPATCTYCTKTGNWDASDPDSGDGPACIQCDGKKESKWLGDTTEIYNNPCVAPPAGDGQCESACEADAACDEKNPGDPCGSGGTCNNNCQCILPPAGCTIGGTSYDDGKCNPSNKCQYCDISKSTTSWSSVPSGKICANNSLVIVSDVNYCNYDENCERGNCSATEWYTSCNGSGSCRAASDHTASYSYTFYVSNGKVLKSDCSEVQVSSSYYCETPVGTCITTSTCNGSMFYKGCYQGSCSSSSTYGYTDTSDDSECDGVVCSTTNYCRNSCDWYTGKKCSGGSCSQGYGGGSCDPYACSGGSCTATCSISCGAVCEDDGDCPGGSTCQANCTCSGVNNPPSCDAGSDKTVNENQSVQLDCSASDPDGDSLSYSWSCTGGSLNNSSILQPVYTAPSVTADTDYACTLSVSDGKGGNCSDSMIVHVKDIPAGEIITPPDVDTLPFDEEKLSEEDSTSKYNAWLEGELVDLGYNPGECPNCKCIAFFKWREVGSSTWNTINGTPYEITANGTYFYAILTNLDSNTEYEFEAFAKNGGSW